MLDETGWNFRHAFYHEENRRTLIKAYGLKFLLVIDGRAGKFDLKNTVIVLVTGLGLIGLSTMFCDFVLLNYSPERKKVLMCRTISRMLAITFFCFPLSSYLIMHVLCCGGLLLYLGAPLLPSSTMLFLRRFCWWCSCCLEEKGICTN